MQNTESVFENEEKNFRDIDIQADHLSQARISDLVIVNKKRKFNFSNRLLEKWKEREKLNISSFLLFNFNCKVTTTTL